VFKRIDHIELLTAAPERAVAFYMNVLGFRERERLRIPQTPQGPLDLVYLELGDTTLEVMCFPEAKARIPERAAELRQGYLANTTTSSVRVRVAGTVDGSEVVKIVRPDLKKS